MTHNKALLCLSILMTQQGTLVSEYLGNPRIMTYVAGHPMSESPRNPVILRHSRDDPGIMRHPCVLSIPGNSQFRDNPGIHT